MAKMFYTLEEAAQRLGKTPEEVQTMAERGELQEFRANDRLMFKREQVDLKAGGDAEDDLIPLADSGDLEPLTLASSGSATGIPIDPMNAKEQTGISIFDADATDEADPSALTRVVPVVSSPGFASDAGAGDPGASGSGSGLMDLTRETDDTSLGANLLDDVYGSETVAAQTQADEMSPEEGGALFESSSAAPAESESMSGGVAIPVAVEAYDGAGSGLVGGLAFGMAASALLAVFVLTLGLWSTGGSMMDVLGSNMWALVGGAAGLTLIGTLVGWFLGKKS
ncbi:MAG: helix-turn-helix domain-containing protein [Phycisphaeraceae bacterium]|nr:helix-turn-helix domain-containing protein [Phycisphaerae bacterium]MBX3393697.1 helix-turn-helix domain-containing protein [Phycisphaeraceae bacterium]HRJ49483.1 helix-turn-helix domain-containing protein [Phycisphaerales bacterium]